MADSQITIRFPDWLADYAALDGVYPTDRDKMELVIGLARENVRQGTGGPFGAAVFGLETHRLVSVGANLVAFGGQSVLHAEITAFIRAQQRAGSYTLRGYRGEGQAVFASSEPCAMCLGSCLWAGVDRIVFAALGEDARKVGFDEGPVFEASWDYLRKAGIEVVPGFMRKEAAKVLSEYAESGGEIYNG